MQSLVSDAAIASSRTSAHVTALIVLTLVGLRLLAPLPCVTSLPPFTPSSLLSVITFGPSLACLVDIAHGHTRSRTASGRPGASSSPICTASDLKAGEMGERQRKHKHARQPTAPLRVCMRSPPPPSPLLLSSFGRTTAAANRKRQQRTDPFENLGCADGAREDLLLVGMHPDRAVRPSSLSLIVSSLSR